MGKIFGEELVDESTGIKHSLVRNEANKVVGIRSEWLFGVQPCGFTSKRLRCWEHNFVSYR